jgi:hypothetical protein
MTLTEIVQAIALSHCGSLTFRFDPLLHSTEVRGPYFEGQSRVVFVDATYGEKQFSTCFTILQTMLNPESADHEVRNTLDKVRLEHERQFEPKVAP